MGVFLLDRTGEPVLGTSCRLWSLSADALVALGAPHPEHLQRLARRRDGHVPSWLARAWGGVLFDDLGDVVLVCRPVRAGSRELRPVGLYRQGSAVDAAWSRAGEHLGVYDTPVAPVLLRLAQVLTVAGGVVVTSLRPPAPGTPVSGAAVRSLLRRSGVLPTRRRPHGRHRS